MIFILYLLTLKHHMEIFLLLIILVFVIISLNKSAANSKATQEAISKLKDEINSLNLKIDTQTLKAEEPQPEIVPVVTEEPQPAIKEEIKSRRRKSKLLRKTLLLKKHLYRQRCLRQYLRNFSLRQYHYKKMQRFR